MTDAQSSESLVRATPEIKMNAEELSIFMEAAFGRPMTWDIEQVDSNGVTVRQRVGTDSLRPGGTISGPTLMALTDGVAYLVVLSRIGPEALAVTSNLNINFLRRPRPGDLVVFGKTLKMGRSLAVIETWVYSDTRSAHNSDDSADRASSELSPEHAVAHPPTDVSQLGDPVAHAIVTYSMSLIHQAEAK